MDSIDLALKEAERLGFGCSYGKYKGAYPNGSGDVLAKAPEPPASNPSVICKHCGQPFEPTHGGQKYCSDECRETVKRIRQSEYYKKNPRPKYKQPAKPARSCVCIVCGADFKTADHRKKACSNECAAERRREISRRWWAAKRKGG